MNSLKSLRHTLLLSLAAGILVFTGCKKEEEDSDTGSALDNSMAESYYNDAADISDQAAEGDLTSFKASGTASHCATITHDTTVSPRTMVIDFGATNCLGHDGRSRRGQILVSYTGRYRDAGSVHTITFNNYFVNDNQVTGTKTVTNEGLNGSGNPWFSVVVNGSVIKANGGGTLTWSSTRQREWFAGSTTPGVFSDDIYRITGTSTGTNAAGDTYSATITSPLRKEIGCRYLVSGTIELTVADKPLRVIDFGAGTCDSDATVTINGNTYNITLR